jgi:hypothetical protein
MKKITSLTPEQAEQMPGWADMWIAIGLSTEPADFELARDASMRAYDLINQPKPGIVLTASSPYAATLAGAIAVTAPEMLSGVTQPVDRATAEAMIRKLKSTKPIDFSDVLYNSGISSLWAGFAAFATFFRDVCGLDDPVFLKNLKVNEDLVHSCGWTWWHEDVVVIADRPQTIRRDDEGRLHCENGPSMEYRDGWGMYHWHGVAIPKDWVTGKKPSAKEALTWENIEQRRCACEIIGWHNILAELKSKVIDRDDDAEIGTLLEVDLPDSGRERFLQVKCGTGRTFAIPVPPTVKTALEANAWTYGLEDVLDQFKPEVRT